MPLLKNQILKAINELSTPYASITTLSKKFDINDNNFIAAFRELERENLIASANTRNCGLTVGACGTPAWSVVDLYVTKFGIVRLNPQKHRLWDLFIKMTENPTSSVLIAALICFFCTIVYSYLGSVQVENKEKN